MSLIHVKLVGLIPTIKGIILEHVNVIELDALETKYVLMGIAFRFLLVIRFYAKQGTIA